MPPDLGIVIARLRPAFDRLGQLVLLLRARRPLGAVAVAGAAIICLTIVLAATWLVGSARPRAVAADAEQAWRYLVVCEQCGYRGRSVVHPARTLHTQGGLFQCPVCGRFKATWFRRGGQALPPGGWSTSQPGDQAAEDAVGNGESP